MSRRKFEKEAKEFDEKVIQIKRVSKKTKGGNRISFTALVVVGDKNGRVGVGLGKGLEVPIAIQKGVKAAKRKLIEVTLSKGTIPHGIEIKRGAAKLRLKPAPEGTGTLAGGPVRAVVEMAGVRNISSKILGTRNKASNVYATFEALKRLSKTAVPIRHPEA